jgi:hypothetical protein
VALGGVPLGGRSPQILPMLVREICRTGIWFSLFLYIICKSIRELVLVTNCIYCVFSAFSGNGLVVNHLFISWRILLALLVNYVGSRLVIIMLVLSAYRTTSALSLTIFGEPFT